MNKDQLKKTLRPMIKECIKEVIFEEGILSSIISEVVKGTAQPLVESRQPTYQQPQRAGVGHCIDSQRTAQRGLASGSAYAGERPVGAYFVFCKALIAASHSIDACDTRYVFRCQYT